MDFVEVLKDETEALWKGLNLLIGNDGLLARTQRIYIDTKPKSDYVKKIYLVTKDDEVHYPKKPINSNQPVGLVKSQHLSGKRIEDIACGYMHALALTKDGDVYSWGSGNFGQLGRKQGASGNRSREFPERVQFNTGVKIKMIACGRNSSYALTQDGTMVYAWGENTWGALGDGTTERRSTPTPIIIRSLGDKARLSAIFARNFTAYALTTIRNLYSWGENKRGLVGNGTINGWHTEPQRIGFPENIQEPIMKMTVSKRIALAILNDGTCWVWGQFGKKKNKSKLTLRSPQRIMLDNDRPFRCSPGTHIYSIPCKYGILLIERCVSTNFGHKRKGCYHSYLLEHDDEVISFKPFDYCDNIFAGILDRKPYSLKYDIVPTYSTTSSCDASQPQFILGGMSFPELDGECEPDNATVARVTGMMRMNSMNAASILSKEMNSERLEAYKMRGTNDRGLCIIFNHQNYIKEQLQARNGSEADAWLIQRTFNELGFTVLIENDRCRSDILRICQTEAESICDVDCFACFILTHGEEGDVLWAKDELYKLEEIVNIFLGTHCPSLIGKPKLFFLQACRGTELEQAVPLEHDAASKSGSRYIPYHSDLLINWSTAPGTLSWRDSQRGSPFIQTLCNQLLQASRNFDWTRSDLLSILTRVNNMVAQGFELTSLTLDDRVMKVKQMPNFYSTLRKKVYFPPLTN